MIYMVTEQKVVAQDGHWLMTFPGFKVPRMHSDAGKQEGLIYENIKLSQAESVRHISISQGHFTGELRILLVLKQ